MNTKSIVSTAKAAPAAGPYSQATRTEQFVFASGQLPIDPVSGDIPDGIEQQTRQSLANLSAVLEAGGASFASVLKTTVFLKNMSDFAVMNGIYAEFFSDQTAGALDHRSRTSAKGRTGRSRERSRCARKDKSRELPLAPSAAPQDDGSLSSILRGPLPSPSRRRNPMARQTAAYPCRAQRQLRDGRTARGRMRRRPGDRRRPLLRREPAPIRRSLTCAK